MPIKSIEVSDPEIFKAKPVVSVNMITYNHEKYIAKAIEGVMSQEVDFPFELVIGEDCSPDNTRDIAIEYQKKYPHNIRVIYPEQNVGPNNNFRRTLEACRGEYIAICEGDDIWLDKTKLKKQVGFLAENPDYVITYHDYDVYKDGEKEENPKKGPMHDTSQRELILGGGGLQTLTICFRNVIEELPEEFNWVTGGDLFVRSLLGNHGKGKFLTNIEPGVYNIHSGGIWSGLKKEQQIIKSIETRFWISAYYKRVNKDDIATEFACSAMRRITDDLVLNKKIFLMWFIKVFFSKAYDIYRRFTKK